MKSALLITLLLTVMSASAAEKSVLHFDTVVLKEGGFPATVCLAYKTGAVKLHPVILMLGKIDEDKLPDWSVGLVEEGYMLAAFAVDYPPDPDPAKRPQWLVFDQRFAHSYVLGGQRAPKDAGRIIDYLISRGDVNEKKIGWLGSSSTGIPGLSIAVNEPRLAAIVAFVSTGAYRQWLDTWIPNGLWSGKTKDLWPETLELLKDNDPILHVDRLFPKAVLMINGGGDKVVDPGPARAFVEKARPYYASDSDRLRLVIYEGFSHNLPRDIIRMYAEHWFHLYMDPNNPPPAPPEVARDMNQSVVNTQINAADHKDVVVGK